MKKFGGYVELVQGWRERLGETEGQIEGDRGRQRVLAPRFYVSSISRDWLCDLKATGGQMDEIPRIRKKVHFGGTVHVYWNFGGLLCTRILDYGAFFVPYILKCWCILEMPSCHKHF